MSEADISIELSELGFSGTLRESGQPDLVAHRPEAWRFTRLARVIGAAKAFAQEELGTESCTAIVEAMISISDMKGDFTVCWRAQKHRPQYNGILARALATEGETDLEFQIGDH